MFEAFAFVKLAPKPFSETFTLIPPSALIKVNLVLSVLSSILFGPETSFNVYSLFKDRPLSVKTPFCVVTLFIFPSGSVNENLTLLIGVDVPAFVFVI